MNLGASNEIQKMLRYASMGRQGCLSSICHHLVITIVSIIMNTTTNTGKNRKKSAEMRKKSQSHLDHNIFSENFTYDQFDAAFSKPIRNINMRIMRKDFKRNQYYNKKIEVVLKF